MRRGGILWSTDYMVSAKSRSSRPATSDATTTAPGFQAPAVPEATKSGAIVDANMWPHDATTVMLRNIPNRYTQEDLLDELTSKGFYAAFDYFHLVMDMRTKRNKGFAFLNLRSPALARRIHAEFHGVHLQRYKSQKVLEVALAEVQGLHANAISYLNAHGGRVQNVWFKPIIFSQDPGQDNWRAIPLIESNLPEDIALVYGSHTSKRSTTRTEQRQRVLTAVMQADDKEEGESESQNFAEEMTITDEQLVEGEYGEIASQVQAFLTDCCGGANQSSEHLLAALEKPRRKHKAKKGNSASLPFHGNQGRSDAVRAEVTPMEWLNAPITNETRTIEIATSLTTSLMMTASHNAHQSHGSDAPLGGSSLFASESPLAGLVLPLGFHAPPAPGLGFGATPAPGIWVV